MRIREQSHIVRTSPHYFHQMVTEAIRDLEADYQDGEIDYDAYYFRMHALKRMLR